MKTKNRIVTLYDIKREDGDWFSLRAYIDSSCNKLYLEGQDFTKLAKDMFGDEEYEYFYVFSNKSVEKLKVIFNNDDVLDAISTFFHGEMLNSEFIELCKKNDIPYELHVI
ncbi:MAG TPA: hypothetical protein PLT36_06875 [Erysipelotrichaceae bacterium]|nr:hypothetical protein [Erysipelotrichaceae bacterium]